MNFRVITQATFYITIANKLSLGWNKIRHVYYASLLVCTKRHCATYFSRDNNFLAILKLLKSSTLYCYIAAPSHLISYKAPRSTSAPPHRAKLKKLAHNWAIYKLSYDASLKFSIRHTGQKYFILSIRELNQCRRRLFHRNSCNIFSFRNKSANYM